jgi:hypothetical protein
VVEYLIDDEKENYDADPDPNHIYRSLLVLDKWLKELSVDV